MERTRFINVDLDLVGRRSVSPFVAAMCRRAFALHEETRRGRSWARMELLAHPASADAGVKRFAALVAKLPPEARAVWDGATKRVLDIGVSAGTEPWTTELVLKPATVRAASAIDAAIVVTVYAYRPALRMTPR